MAKVKVQDCGKGLNLDLTPEELEPGYWTSCTNMRFCNGYAQRFNGIPQLFGPYTHAPHYITPYQNLSDRFWITAGNAKAYYSNSSGSAEITRQVEIPMVSIVRTSATLATVTTSAPHGFGVGAIISIFNTIPSAYNVAGAVGTVTSPTTFTYPLLSDPVTNATTVGGLVQAFAASVDYTGGRDNRWSGGVLGGVLVMNNGVDVPQYLQTGVNKLRPLPGWASTWRAAFMVPFKQFLLAFDINKTASRAEGRNPHMMKWSVPAEPGTIPTSWDANDVTNIAGEVDIAETPDLLVDALQLGDALIVYKQRSMYAVRYVGGQYVFQIQRIPGDSGMLARGCGVNTPRGHVVLTAGDVVINTGQGVESIANGRIRQYIFNNLDSTHYARAFVTSNPQRNEVLICFPEVGETNCTKAAVWNWADNTWGMRTLNGVNYGATGLIDDQAYTAWDQDGESWELDTTTWTENAYNPNEARLLFASDTAALAFDVSSSDDGVTQLTGSLERVGMDMGDGTLVKVLRAIYPRIEAPQGSNVSIQFGASMLPNSEITWAAPVTFTPKVDIKADSFSSGRYLAVRLSAATPWRMKTMTLDVEKSGSY